MATSITIPSLIALEWLEQMGWETEIPAWHPRNSDQDDRDDADEVDDDDDEDVSARADEDDDDDGGGDEFPWDEHNRLKREAAEASKRSRAAEREAKKQRQRAQKESGQYDEILSEKDEEVAAAAERAEAAEYALEKFQRDSRVSKIAGRLGFRDPSDALAMLNEDDVEDDNSTERALKRLAREKPYLVDGKRASGAPVNGERSTLSYDDVKKMSQDEINGRWDEVQKALSTGTA